MTDYSLQLEDMHDLAVWSSLPINAMLLGRLEYPVDVHWTGSDHAAGHAVDALAVEAIGRLLALPADGEGARRLSWPGTREMA